MTTLDKKILDKQVQHWENYYITNPETFDVSPSTTAIKAAEAFNKEGITMKAMDLLCIFFQKKKLSSWPMDLIL